MKITTVQYLAYDSNKMFIGSFEDEEYAQRWADKHGGYVDRHLIEREENRIYDNLLIEMTREKSVKEFAEFIESQMKERDYMGIKYKQGVFSDRDIDEFVKQFLGTEVEE